MRGLRAAWPERSKIALDLWARRFVRSRSRWVCSSRSDTHRVRPSPLRSPSASPPPWTRQLRSHPPKQMHCQRRQHDPKASRDPTLARKRSRSGLGSSCSSRERHSSMRSKDPHNRLMAWSRRLSHRTAQRCPIPVLPIRSVRLGSRLFLQKGPYPLLQPPRPARRRDLARPQRGRRRRQRRRNTITSPSVVSSGSDSTPSSDSAIKARTRLLSVRANGRRSPMEHPEPCRREPPSRELLRLPSPFSE